MSSRILIDQVGKDYLRPGGEGFTALAPTECTIEAGEFFSLVGPSGCGKTTMLNLVAGLISATTGQIRIDDRIVEDPSRDIGIVFQQPTLLGWRTVLDNVLLPAKIARRTSPEMVDKADQLLELTGLADYRNRYPDELSGGMQQRTAIARALLTRPTVLLMDEPFSALDEFTRETLNDELLRIWSENPMTILFITHNIGEAVYLSDRIGVMTSGPGRLRTVVQVVLERPRSAALRADERFFRHQTEIRELINKGSERVDRPNGSADQLPGEGLQSEFQRVSANVAAEGTVTK
jgi:NitT/TauT family transport system ATP-binding protein